MERDMRMSSPLESPEFETLYGGNLHDDDGQVIDSFFIETDAPAKPVIEPISTTPLIRPTPRTRLITGTILIDSTYINPTQLIPADENRKSLSITGFSNATTPAAKDYANVTDENGKVLTSSLAMRVRHNNVYSYDGHTGAVWAMPSATLASDTFELTWTAVTI